MKMHSSDGFTPHPREAPPVKAGRNVGSVPQGQAPKPRVSTRGAGFTLAEVLLGGVALAVAIAAILGAYLGQVTLSEHARNLQLAVQDANRVMEQLRQKNIGCGSTPSVVPTDGAANWNAWLDAAGGGKSIQPNPTANERIVVTCQKRDGGSAATDYCGSANQVGNEWVSQAGATTNFNPIRVTVAVCWRHRNRTLGECTWDGAALNPDDAGVTVASDTAGVVDSPAMLTTLITCR